MSGCLGCRLHAGLTAQQSDGSEVCGLNPRLGLEEEDSGPRRQTGRTMNRLVDGRFGSRVEFRMCLLLATSFTIALRTDSYSF